MLPSQLPYNSAVMCLSKLKLWVTLVTALFLIGCNVDIDPVFENANEFSVRIHESNKAVVEYKMLKGTEGYKQCVDWVQANKRGWSPTPASYVPGVKVSGAGYDFNFIGDMVVVNYKDGQFSKNVGKNEYEFLIQKNT